MSKQNAAGAAPQENKMGVLPVGKLLAGMAVPMMISMLVQGMSIPAVARKLNLALPQEKAPETFGIEIPEEAGKLMDHRLTETDLAAGDTLKEVALPEGTRVVMIKRDGELIVPDGSVKLKVGDKLLMIMGNQFDESE